MKKRTIPLFTMMSGLIVAGLLVLSQSNAGVVRRKAAEFRNFDASESSNDLGVASPTLIWTKTIPIKPGEKVLYITMSATGDTHGGAAGWFNCKVDGVNCNNGTGGADGAPAGWIALNKMPAPSAITNCGINGDGGGGTGDCHDNRVYYTWCKVIQPPPQGPTTRTISLNLATSVPGTGTTTAFIEAAHFFIDVQQGSASGTDTPTCIQGNP